VNLYKQTILLHKLPS